MESSGATEAPAFRDVDDHARRIVEKVDALPRDARQRAHRARDDGRQENNEAMRRMAEFGLEQNEQVKKVSGWAAILFAPTLVGTIYGMNFDYMPELHWVLGYPMALGLMAATSCHAVRRLQAQGLALAGCRRSPLPWRAVTDLDL